MLAVLSVVVRMVIMMVIVMAARGNDTVMFMASDGEVGMRVEVMVRVLVWVKVVMVCAVPDLSDCFQRNLDLGKIARVDSGE